MWDFLILLKRDIRYSNQSVNNTIINLPSNHLVKDKKMISYKLLPLLAMFLLEISTIKANLSNTMNVFDKKQSFTSVFDNIPKIYRNRLASPD